MSLSQVNYNGCRNIPADLLNTGSCQYSREFEDWIWPQRPEMPKSVGELTAETWAWAAELVDTTRMLEGH